jgi:predicted kinase
MRPFRRDRRSRPHQPQRSEARHSPVVDLGTEAATGIPTLFLIVGLPGAGKTTRAKELMAERHALLLTPDAWMMSLFGREFERDGWSASRDVLEGQLIKLAIEVLRLRLSVVLDFGLWARDERSALRWLARSVDASPEVVYLPADRATQLRRIQRRQQAAPDRNFLITEHQLEKWRAQFEVPDAAELAGADLPSPPDGYADWAAWAADRWPARS